MKTCANCTILESAIVGLEYELSEAQDYLKSVGVFGGPGWCVRQTNTTGWTWNIFAGGAEGWGHNCPTYQSAFAEMQRWKDRYVTSEEGA